MGYSHNTTTTAKNTNTNTHLTQLSFDAIYVFNRFSIVVKVLVLVKYLVKSRVKMVARGCALSVCVVCSGAAAGCSRCMDNDIRAYVDTRSIQAGRI